MSLNQLINNPEEFKQDLTRKNYTEEDCYYVINDLFLEFENKYFTQKRDHDFLIEMDQYIAQIRKLCSLCEKKVDNMDYKKIKDCCGTTEFGRFKKDPEIKEIVSILNKRLKNDNHPVTTFYLPDTSPIIACAVYVQELREFYIDINPDFSPKNGKLVPSSKQDKYKKLKNKLKFSFNKYKEITTENVFDFFCDLIEAIYIYRK